VSTPRTPRTLPTAAAALAGHPARPHRTSRRRRVAAAVAVVLALAGATTPAAAQIDGTNLGFPTPGGADTTTYAMVGPASVSTLLDSSAYTLGNVDPVTGALSGADVTSTMSAEYAMTADLADSSLMAVDMAQMALEAQRLADAQRRAQAGQSTGRLRAGAVPSPYDRYIADAVARYCPSITETVLAAQIKTESNFNPRARNPVSGASGIAQFMPSTWASFGVDGNGDGRKDIWDPADAIPAAARYDCHLKDLVRKVPGDPVTNMLAAYNAGPGNVLKYNGVPPFAETRGYVTKILAEAEAMDANPYAGSQQAIGPDGCPTTAPANTMRGGSDRIGIARLCADSVAQARTPEAAIAIKYALSHLGVPYSQPRRNEKDWDDCSSFVSAAYAAAVGKWWTGNNHPWTGSIRQEPQMRVITLAQAKPGDYVMNVPGHVSMQLAHGFKVHTSTPGDVSHVTTAYTSAYWVAWFDASRLPRR